MSSKIFLSVIIGILLGYGSLSGLYTLPLFFTNNLGLFSDIGLMLLLLFVGIDIGSQRGILDTVKKMGFRILLVPFATILGSIAGGMMASFLLTNLTALEGAALASGLGWYSLSANILSAEGFVTLSALAFLSNVIREIIGLVSMPFVSKNIGFLESVVMAGATAMDTSLPMISKTTDNQTAVIGFVSGVICTASVPIILPILIQFF